MSPCNLPKNDKAEQEFKLILSIRFDLINVSHKDKSLSPFRYSVAMIYKVTKGKDGGVKEASQLAYSP